MMHQSLLSKMRRRIPLFPFIPLAPIAVLAAQAIAIVMLYRRVRMVERQLL